MSFWYPAVVELKSFIYKVFGQQYSLNFILVSHIHFEMFGTMADIFFLAVFLFLTFAIFLAFVCFIVSPISSLLVCLFQIRLLS